MGNYEQLKNAIAEVIKTNGNQEITGQILQNVLKSIVSTLGANATFAGIAVPSTNPGTPDGPVFYIASTKGLYANFDNLEIETNDGLSIFLRSGSFWTKQSTGIASAEDINQLINSLFSAQDENINAFKESVISQIEDYKPIIIQGNVTNAADEEDLHADSATHLISLANRSSINGMGYVILRKNKSFEEQTRISNTIYEIRYDISLNNASVNLPANCILYFNGGSLLNGTLNGANTGIVHINKCIFNNITLGGTWLLKNISTSLFTEISDNNILKNIAVLQNDTVENNVVIEKELYVDMLSYQGLLNVKSNTNVKLYADIHSNPSSVEGGSIIYITGHNVHFDGNNHIIEGEKYVHTGTSGESVYCIRITGSNNVVENVIAEKSWGDGIMVSGAYNTIRNVVCDSNRRQGLSITNDNILVENSSFINTGSGGIVTNPGAGIDIEPGNHIIIRNCIFSNNYKNATWAKGITNDLQIVSDLDGQRYTSDVTIENCKMESVVLGQCSDIIFKECLVSSSIVSITEEIDVEFINTDVQKINNLALPKVKGLSAKSEDLYDAINKTGGINLSYLDAFGNLTLKQNTANCYIVSSDNYYRLPLVYGNGLTEGVNLFTIGKNAFVNHLGNTIESAYIEHNEGCNVDSVGVLWETKSELIKNVKIIDGIKCRYISFEVSGIPDQGANAVIGVKDSNGVVMWSWHIWCYKDKLTTIQSSNFSGISIEMLNVNLGWMWDSDEKLYGINTLYQAGRKDAIPPFTSHLDASIRSVFGEKPFEVSNVSPGNYQTLIQNPNVYYKTYPIIGQSQPYWDLENKEGTVLNTKVYKSLYDPCPVGFSMVIPEGFTGFTKTGRETSDVNNFKVIGSYDFGWNIDLGNDKNSFFPCYSFNNGTPRRDLGIYGTSHINPSGNLSIAYIAQSVISPRTNLGSTVIGCCVRPFKENWK